MIWFFIFGCVLNSGFALKSNEFPLNSWTLKQEENDSGLICLNRTVPTDVYMDLHHCGFIGNPYDGYNDIELRWVAKKSWNYTTEFSIPAEFLQNGSIYLIFDGLDTIATIYLDGVKLAKTDNMYLRHTLSLRNASLTFSPKIRGLGQKHKLTVVFESPILAATFVASEHKRIYNYSIPPNCTVPAQRGECHPNFLRKMQASFSWDWGPAFPTSGIHGAVRLVNARPCYFQDFAVSAANRDGRWHIETSFRLACGEKVEGWILIDVLSVISPKSYPISAETGSKEISFSVPVGNLGPDMLWWPNGYGNQTTFTVQASLSVKGEIVDTINRSFGFRAIELQEEVVKNKTGSAAGLTFYFKVNGIPIFLKGSNWIPDSLFHTESGNCENYEFFFDSMKQAHFNALRVWGGGNYEADCFYDLADKYGILIWQDLLFACSLYPVDTKFLASVSEELTQQIWRLKSHPSVLLWAGNNENEKALVDGWYSGDYDTNRKKYINDYMLLYQKTLAPIVRKLDPDRIFLRSSPSNGPKMEGQGFLKNPSSEFYGDVHPYDYSRDPWATANMAIPRCASEYGYQSLPALATLAKALGSENLTIFSHKLEHREHHANGIREMLTLISKDLNLPGNCSSDYESCAALNTTAVFPRLVYLTQVSQAMAIKQQTEHYRRSKSTTEPDGRGRTMCALYWQLNDVWQAPTWSSIDFDRRWKMLHYFAKDFFSPLLVSGNVKNKTLYVHIISDLVNSVPNSTLILDFYKVEELKPIKSISEKIDLIRPLKSALVFKTKIDSNEMNEAFFVKLKLSNNKPSQSTENFALLRSLKEIPGEKFGKVNITTVTKKENGDFTITISTNKIAPFVWVDSGWITGIFNRNGFFLLETTGHFNFKPTQDCTVSNLKKQLSVVSL